MEIYFNLDETQNNQFTEEVIDINTEYNDIINIYYNIDDIARINIKNVIVFMERQQKMLMVR
jgi:hypothetical protein